LESAPSAEESVTADWGEQTGRLDFVVNGMVGRNRDFQPVATCWRAGAEIGEQFATAFPDINELAIFGLGSLGGAAREVDQTPPSESSRHVP
jgi:hypothetical protein